MNKSNAKTSPQPAPAEMQSPTAPEPLSVADAARIATYSPRSPGSSPAIETAQAAHRIRLVGRWPAVRPGARVLELGCGQGSATAVLAAAVGPSGHVDAVDPGPLDYGAPFTLGQAQAHMSASAVGDRITWHRATPQDFLSSSSSSSAPDHRVWDVAVLAHCVWYFASERELAGILAALRGRVGRVCVAEYALRATERAAVPHVLAVLARGSLESHRAESVENVRSPLSPAAIRRVAGESRWECAHESFVVPEAGLLDGSWEVGTVASDGFLREVDEAVSDERVKSMIVSARDATVAAVEALDGAKVQTMDVWVAVFA